MSFTRFYSAGSDFANILDAFLSLPKVHIYHQTSSTRELHEVYRTDIEEIAAAYKPYLSIVLEPNHSLVSQQWVDVIPGYGESYGKCVGWGLIRLSCNTPSDEYLGASEVNRISERKAVLYYDVHKEMGAPEDWDWDLVNQCYRQVTKVIRSLSVAKHDGYFVLPQALQLQHQGVELV